MEFRILGPVEVALDGHDIDLGRRRERLLLGLLLMQPGRVISVDRLVDLLWDEPAPDSAVEQLRVATSRLRRALSAVAGCDLGSRAGGYAIDIAPERVDAPHFVREAERAAGLTDPEQRLATLEAALALWRGPLLADVADQHLRDRVGRRLHETRATARDLRLSTLLELDRADAAAVELFDLVVADPTDERLTALLMRALWAQDRRVDALRAYHELREHLRDEFGVDPGPPVQALFAEILRADTGVPADDDPEARTPVSQLPADPATFTGRGAELAALDAALAGDRPGTPVAVVVGAGGCGKSALALRWARTRAVRYPDGQLWIDLRGNAQATALPPLVVLQRLLGALGIDPGEIPDDVDQAATLYRSRLARHRMLVVLDNALSADQVRPLLPGGDRSAALVTSRNRLTDLVARHGAERMLLDGLPTPEAVELIARIAGDDRVADDPAASEDLVGLCGHLPLALCIAAAQLADDPARPVAAQVAAIRGGRLLREGAERDDPSPVRAVFDQAYASLDDAARRLFVLIGTCPAGSADAGAAAALAGGEVDEAAARLATLAQAHLVQAAPGGRFGPHDLIRGYAHSRAADVADEERGAALHRHAEHYVATSTAAVDALSGRPVEFVGYDRSVRARWATIENQAAAKQWLEAESSNAVAVAVHAAAGPGPRHAIWLATTLVGWMFSSAPHADAMALQRAAVEAAERLGDEASAADAHRRIGVLHWRHGNNDGAEAEFRLALAAARAAGDQERTADALNNLGGVAMRRNRHADAVAHFEEAAAAYRRIGDRGSEAMTTSNLGIVAWSTGDYRRARDAYEQTVAVFVELGDDVNAARALGNLGNVHHKWGNYQTARDHHERALEIFRRAGDRLGQSDAISDLALAHIGLGAYDRALALLDEGLAISTAIGARPSEASQRAAYGRLHQERGEHARAREHYLTTRQIARETGAPDVEATACNGLGLAQRGLGEFTEALAAHEAALVLARAAGTPYEEGRALDGLACGYAARGDVEEAETHWDRALAVFDRLGVPEAGEVRAHLDAVRS